MMKKQNYCCTILLLMMSVSLGTLQARSLIKLRLIQMEVNTQVNSRTARGMARGIGLIQMEMR